MVRFVARQDHDISHSAKPVTAARQGHGFEFREFVIAKDHPVACCALGAPAGNSAGYWEGVCLAEMVNRTVKWNDSSARANVTFETLQPVHRRSYLFAVREEGA